jgi:ABC-2 type transport system ATP-binding protein
LEYLQRVCRIFGVTESRAIEVLELVSLKDACDRGIRALSAGMLQKFAIVHALVHKPRLIVADEMTANLDPQARSELLDLVLQLQRDQKVTFLLSSHILPELSRICDSVAIINRGKVWTFEKLSELYDKYAIGIIRVTTNNPEVVASEVKKLRYAKDVRTDIRGLSVRVVEGKEDDLYEDVPKEVLEDIKARMEREAGKLALRKASVKHPFGIMKRIFNQGYLLPYGA